MQNYKVARILALFPFAGLFAGCSIMAPQYTPNYDAVETLKSENLQPMRVVDIAAPSSTKRNVNQLTIRGSTYTSPNGSFTEYFKAALQDELDHAGLLDQKSATEISGVLLRNTLDAAGFNIGAAEIEAKLTVRREDKIVYEGAKSIRHEWPSSFVGAVAIPRAAQNYPLALRKLLNEFYSDSLFIGALKKQE